MGQEIKKSYLHITIAEDALPADNHNEPAATSARSLTHVPHPCEDMSH